jgi:hypothetical protein
VLVYAVASESSMVTMSRESRVLLLLRVPPHVQACARVPPALGVIPLPAPGKFPVQHEPGGIRVRPEARFPDGRRVEGEQVRLRRLHGASPGAVSIARTARSAAARPRYRRAGGMQAAAARSLRFK